MTAEQLRGFNTGPALVAYSRQPDASQTVCDLKATGLDSGQRVAAFERESSCNRPDALLFEAKTPSGAGPRLSVSVDRDDSRRLHYSVIDGSRTQVAVVEWLDPRSFRIVSRGGRGRDGSTGTDGMDGTPGMPGMSALCPSFPAGSGGPGGSGMSGGSGEDGHNGGPGGNIQVNIACSPSVCSEIRSVVRTTVLSVGGLGGRGGPGGRGGRGGEGGPGGREATCTDSEGYVTSLPSGPVGFRGPDGLDGWPGLDGTPGRPGEVIIAITPQVGSEIPVNTRGIGHIAAAIEKVP
jgi:hypothetical protein